MWQELMPNLLAEAIGIIITVLGINQLMQWRERRKWIQVKQRLYRRIALSTDAFLSDLVIVGPPRQGIHSSDLTRDGKLGSRSNLVRLHFDWYVKPQLLGCSEENWHLIRNSLHVLLGVLRHISDGYFDLLEPEVLASILDVEDIASQLVDLLSPFDLRHTKVEVLVEKTERLAKAIVALEKRPEIETHPKLPLRFVV